MLVKMSKISKNEMGDGYLTTDEEVGKQDSDIVVVAKPKTQQDDIKSLHKIM